MEGEAVKLNDVALRYLGYMPVFKKVKIQSLGEQTLAFIGKWFIAEPNVLPHWHSWVYFGSHLVHHNNMIFFMSP